MDNTDNNNNDSVVDEDNLAIAMAQQDNSSSQPNATSATSSSVSEGISSPSNSPTSTPTKKKIIQNESTGSPSSKAAELRRKLREKEEELKRLREELTRSLEDIGDEVDDQATDYVEEESQNDHAETTKQTPVTPVKEQQPKEESNKSDSDSIEQEGRQPAIAAVVPPPVLQPVSSSEVLKNANTVDGDVVVSAPVDVSPATTAQDNVDLEEVQHHAPVVEGSKEVKSSTTLLVTPVKQSPPQQERSENVLVVPPPAQVNDIVNDGDAAPEQRKEHLLPTVADVNEEMQTPAKAETSMADTTMNTMNSVPPSPFIADESPVKEKFDDDDEELQQVPTSSTMDTLDDHDIESGTPRKLEDQERLVEKAVLAGAKAASNEANDATIPLNHTAEESYDDTENQLLSASGRGGGVGGLPHHIKNKSPTGSQGSQGSDASTITLSVNEKRKRRCFVAGFAIMAFVTLGASLGALMAAKLGSDGNGGGENSKNAIDGTIENAPFPPAQPSPTPPAPTRPLGLAPTTSSTGSNNSDNEADSEYYGTWSVSPSGAPTREPLSPSMAPTDTQAPSASPTDMPSMAPTPLHSIHPTMAPTNSPLAEVIAEALGGSTRFLTDVDAPAYRAYHVMIEQEDIQELLRRLPTDLANEDGPGSEDTTTATATSRLFQPQNPLGMTVWEKLVQRFASLTVHMTVSGSKFEIPGDECSWNMITCSPHESGSANGAYVTELQMARSNYNGQIATEIGLFKALQVIDLAENDIDGSIPEELYELTNLKKLYLEHNKLTGTLSEGIANLDDLESIYVGNNDLTGPLPQGLQSKNVNNIRPLRYISVHNNRMSGSVPENLRLRKLFYLDLSFNNFSGQLPESMFDRHYALRHLYLEHNSFTGRLPKNLPEVGNGRLIDAFLNDNEFSGDFPDGFAKDNLFLLTLNIQNTKISGFNKDICKIAVHEEGEVVELGANCDICKCDPLCDRCYKEGAPDEWTF